MGESITSGILSAWLVKDGDFVEKDQPIYELETDKITSEATAEVSGTIQFKVEQDAEVDIGSTVATIDESAQAPSNNKATTTSKAEEPAEEPATSASTVTESPKQEEAKALPKTGQSDEILSPASRKHSIEKQVDINKVEGTGKGGRITKGDILPLKPRHLFLKKKVPLPNSIL